MKGRLQKILSILLYSLPIVFFIVCYFLIITSGEDIFQGANTTPNVIGDSIDAFHHSSRLADMYAWSVINFFDYSFQFGPDIIFRIIDVLAATGILYMMSYIVLQRRPRLNLKDAAIFNLSFLFLFLTQHGYTLYAGFSAIHNYLFISFFTLLFLIFYIRDLWGRPVNPSPIFMLILGFVFGFASNVTSIVFLLSLVLYALYLKLKKQKLKIKEFVFSWRGASILGIIIALILIYVVGNGLSDYEATSDYIVTYDYLPLANVFSDPINSIERIFIHIGKNFGRFILPFLVVGVPTIIAIFIYKRNNLLKRPSFSTGDRNFIIASIIFIILHILVFSQLIYPTRLVLPAYLLMVAVFLFVLFHFFTRFKYKRYFAYFTPLLIILSLTLVVIRSFFAIDYRNKVLPILNEIKNTNQTSYCVERKDISSKSLPYLHLGQDDLLTDWALPETIYDKSVTICDN